MEDRPNSFYYISTDDAERHNFESQLDVDIESISDKLISGAVIETYPNYSKHNKCLIINNAFTGQEDERHGTHKDKDDLKSTFEKLGYKVVVKNDLSDKGMLSSLKDFVNDSEQKLASSTIVVVLSHGSVRGLCGVNGGVVATHTFLACLNASNAPLLAGKPKLVFLQACRGGGHDSGCENVETDGPDTLILPVESDILVCYSTPPNYVSYRNPISGSWFVQELCVVLDQHARTHDINTLLTCVNNRVSERFGMSSQSTQVRKQISTFDSRFRKLFYFFPGAEQHSVGQYAKGRPGAPTIPGMAERSRQIGTTRPVTPQRTTSKDPQIGTTRPVTPQRTTSKDPQIGTTRTVTQQSTTSKDPQFGTTRPARNPPASTSKNRQLQIWCEQEHVIQGVVLKCNENIPHDAEFFSDGSAIVLHVEGADYFIHCPYSTNLYLKASYRGSALRDVQNGTMIPNTTIVAYKKSDANKVEFLDLCNPDVTINPIICAGGQWKLRTATNVLVLQAFNHSSKLLIYRICSGERSNDLICNVVVHALCDWSLATNGVLAYWDDSATTICICDVNGSRRKTQKITLNRPESVIPGIHLGENGTVIAVTSNILKLFRLYDVRSKRLIYDRKENGIDSFISRSKRMIFNRKKDDYDPLSSTATSEDDRLIVIEMEKTMKVLSLRRVDTGGVPLVEHSWTLSKAGDGASTSPVFRKINGIHYIQYRRADDLLGMWELNEANNTWYPLY